MSADRVSAPENSSDSPDLAVWVTPFRGEGLVGRVLAA